MKKRANRGPLTLQDFSVNADMLCLRLRRRRKDWAIIASSRAYSAACVPRGQHAGV